ncbi:MAG: cupredoxin domain-containing protein [bacterium]|nr:cupredoxin domain-containing protein [bacterium]
MKKIILLFAALIIAMEGLGWWMYKKSQKSDSAPATVSQQLSSKSSKKELNTESQKDESREVKKDSQKEQSKDVQANNQPFSNWSNDSSQAASPFPAPSVEKIGNVTQRTIHMGVRQWEWIPEKITANYGEKVILIMHNADVTHSISIPELNVRQEIPNEGAVVQFTAAQRGTFSFFCDTPCGKGHGQMEGEITIL